MATEIAQLGSMVGYLKRAAEHTITISADGRIQHLDDEDSVLRKMIYQCRNIRKLKRSTLWEVLKESFRDPGMWLKPGRISGPIKMPKNKWGWGGGLAPGYGGRVKGKFSGPTNYLNIDIRRGAIKIYSVRPYPPKPSSAMTLLVKSVLKLWILRQRRG